MFGVQFPTDPMMDHFLSSVCVLVGKLCVSKLCVCVGKLCVSKLCMRKLCVSKLEEEAAGGGEGGRKCTTKNKNPTQWCGEKTESN